MRQEKHDRQEPKKHEKRRKCVTRDIVLNLDQYPLQLRQAQESQNTEKSENLDHSQQLRRLIKTVTTPGLLLLHLLLSKGPINDPGIGNTRN